MLEGFDDDPFKLKKYSYDIYINRYVYLIMFAQFEEIEIERIMNIIK